MMEDDFKENYHFLFDNSNLELKVSSKIFVIVGNIAVCLKDQDHYFFAYKPREGFFVLIESKKTDDLFLRYVTIMVQ